MTIAHERVCRAEVQSSHERQASAERRLFAGWGFWRSSIAKLCGVTSITFGLALSSPAAEPPVPIGATDVAELSGLQQMLELPLRVVGEDGRPVAGAKVTPWALRSPQGHSFWREDDPRAEVSPRPVSTDQDGMAVVRYPRFRNLKERTGTLSVSVFVDHPEFAYRSDLHIDVPLEEEGPHRIQLARGVSLEVFPTIDGQPVELENLHAFWSDGRSWVPGAGPEKTASGSLRFPAMPAGMNNLLVVKLEGDQATHVSALQSVELIVGKTNRIELPLHAARPIEGKLSDDVPRPVHRGRIKLLTLPPESGGVDRVDWFTWVPVREDGTFTIPAWLPGEPLQLIALCDGYMAASGKAPSVVAKPRDPATDPFFRPQVFEPADGDLLEVEMVPLMRCIATVVDEDGEPVAGVEIAASPNVGWWNYGSQVYGDSLVRGERLLRERDYKKVEDSGFPRPFRGKTDGEGQVTLELPDGKHWLAVISDIYELPVFLGQREVQVELTPGETTHIEIRLQPRGTERLGEWDKLAGVVFGCSTREGRRICALPGVREQMEEFTKRFREGKNQRDPKLLAEAYTLVADAFAGVGDERESARWRRKAAEQASLVVPTK